MKVAQLEALRVKSGLTQVELAAKLGVNQGTVSMWERGTRPVTPARLAEIVAICKGGKA